ncbi:MAG: LacI family DNA-binding transcriptional regulator [Treponema sp.]|nr:LacI family DNA-binding transcriptional regulator [Treponema sp.]
MYKNDLICYTDSVDDKVIRRHQFLKGRDMPLTFGFAAAVDFSSYIGQEYVAGIMHATADYGINFINMADAVRHSMVEDSYFLSKFLAKTQFMQTPLVDGLVTWASSLAEYMENEKIRSLFSSFAPLPMVDIGYLDIPGVPSIRIDNAHAMHLIVSHLVRVHKFRSIIFIGTKFSKPHLTRLEFFKKEMAAFALPCDDSQIFLSDSLDFTDVAALMETVCTLSPFPQAIVTSSDIIASQVIDELEKHGISVPEDVAVTGFNNQLVGITSSTPITTIDLAYFSRGYRAVEVLIDRIIDKNEISTEPILVPPSLLIRQSCRCFEEDILNAFRNESFSRKVPGENASQDEIRAYLEHAVTPVIPYEEKKSRAILADAILSDLYHTNVPPPQKDFKVLPLTA